MSYTRFIEAFFDLNYTETTIRQIFNAGKIAALTYSVFENNGWKGRLRGDQLSPDDATRKVIDYLENKTEQAYGPVVNALYVAPDNEQRVFLMSIRRTKLGKIEVTWNCLDPTEKTFASGEEGFDFHYFLNKFIDVYGQFELISLEASFD